MDFGKLVGLYGATGAAAAPYDMNRDGRINAIDFSMLAGSFGMAVSPPDDVGTITLQGGQLYPLKVEYYDNTSVASVRLSWKSASTPRQPVPTSRLYPPDYSGSEIIANSSAAALSGPSLFSGKTIDQHQDESII
jgi:hypothetical protein